MYICIARIRKTPLSSSLALVCRYFSLNIQIISNHSLLLSVYIRVVSVMWSLRKVLVLEDQFTSPWTSSPCP